MRSGGCGRLLLLKLLLLLLNILLRVLVLLLGDVLGLVFFVGFFVGFVGVFGGGDFGGVVFLIFSIISSSIRKDYFLGVVDRLGLGEPEIEGKLGLSLLRSVNIVVIIF